MTKPASSAREQVAASSPVLPIPAGPWTRTSRPVPACAAATPLASSANSDSRSNNGDAWLTLMPTKYQPYRRFGVADSIPRAPKDQGGGVQISGTFTDANNGIPSETGPNGLLDALRHSPRPRRDPDRRVHHHRTRATAPIPRLARAQLRNRSAASRGPRQHRPERADPGFVAVDSMRRLFPKLGCRPAPTRPSVGRAYRRPARRRSASSSRGLVGAAHPTKVDAVGGMDVCRVERRRCSGARDHPAHLGPRVVGARPSGHPCPPGLHLDRATVRPRSGRRRSTTLRQPAGAAPERTTPQRPSPRALTRS